MEEIKYIISELNKPPFNRGLNVVSYDSLRGEQRLEILLQVFDEIDPKLNSESLRVGDPEEIVSTILETLRIMKYVPPIDIDPSEFRQALVLGDRTLITHILNWLLNRLPALKKRAYLAKFLVKIELSPEVEGDHDVLLVYQQYQRMIDEFKSVHNTYENFKKTIGSVHDIQKDVKTMEEEKEQIAQKLNNIKRRVDVNNNPELFALVKEYKEEKDKNEKFFVQLQQQEIELQHTQQKLNRLEQHLKEAQNNYHFGSSPQDLIDKMAEEVKIKRHLINEVLPSELEQLKRYVSDIEEIESQPGLSNEYLAKLNAKIQTINREINNTVERKMLNNDPMEDKMALFRQNASIVAKKRETTSHTLTNFELEFKKLQEDIKQKRSGLKDDDQPLKGEELKHFITSLRERSNNFKIKRNQLAEMKTESGIMQNTLEILKNKDKQITETLIAIEEQKGISGYFSMQENCLNKVNDDNKSQTVDELNDILKKLSDDINQKKTILAPIIKDLRPLRQKCQELQSEYEQRKHSYDSCAAGLESNAMKFENEIKNLNKEINAMESNIYLIECQLEVMNARQLLLDEEMKLFVSQEPEDKEKSILVKLQNELNSEQIMKDKLQQQQKDFKNNESENMKQLKMWKDLQTLFAVKLKCLEQQMENNVRNEYTINKRDHLVL